MQIESTIYHLEMVNREDLKKSAKPAIPVDLRPITRVIPELNRFFYTAIGGDWFWVDRLSWDYQQWQTYLDRPEQQTWVLYVEGNPAGYFELNTDGTSTELAYFGLLTQFTGLRLGGWLLTRAVEIAWETCVQRVWVHTCSEDHPSALGNYRARGFSIFKEEKKQITLPDHKPGPW